MIRIRTQKPYIGYPGSTLQNTYAEDLVHGYLLWDIDRRDAFDVRFCALPNPKPYVTIDWAGSIDDVVRAAQQYPLKCRFRIRSKETLAQKEVANLTHRLHHELQATEVTFKDDHVVNRDAISAGTTTLVKDDLRNPTVLLRLLADYHKGSSFTDADWAAVRDQVDVCLATTVAGDIVRNTKWSLRQLEFDNTFAYGEGNVINFDQMPGIVGIFGPNRAGKSSIVGTMMYALHNTTDRGNVKNLHVVNVRHPYCRTKAVVNVNGTNYVFERQTTKTTLKNGQTYANTHLNVFRIDPSGEAVDLCGEERKDTEKTIRLLIGTSDDCLLTSVAAQDDIKQFINQGSARRRQTLSRFLDLDIFDRMHDLAKDDVNVNKAALRNFPDRDWGATEQQYVAQLGKAVELIRDHDDQLHDAHQRLDDAQRQLTAFRDFEPVTQGQADSQASRVASLRVKLAALTKLLADTDGEIAAHQAKLGSVSSVLVEHDLAEMKRRLESYRVLEASVEALRAAHDADDAKLKAQERSLKILDEVPCGDQFPGCKFIKDAVKARDKVDPQRTRSLKSAAKLKEAEAALGVLAAEGLAAKVDKVEQLHALQSRLMLALSTKQLQRAAVDIDQRTAADAVAGAEQRLLELNEALQNQENVEVVSLRHTIDGLIRTTKRLDAEKLQAATDAGRVQAALDHLDADRGQRQSLLQLMKAHEVISQGFSKRGIPSLIVASQLPVINAEVSQILTGIVDFSIELEIDDDSDSMEVYINYGDSRRPIELCSGMEKMVASVAIRVALINVSSLPKSDMFVIDEGFGALDDAGVEACNRLLVSLKRYFRTIVVITHVEGIKDVADHVIEINKIEKDSQVVYNTP